MACYFSLVSATISSATRMASPSPVCTDNSSSYSTAIFPIFSIVLFRKYANPDKRNVVEIEEVESCH